MLAETPRSFRRRQRGQSLVEFALVLPLFMLIVLGAIDFGRVTFSWIQVTNAAREGAAYAITNPTDILGVTGIASRAQQEANSQSQRGEGALTVTVTCHDLASPPAVVPCDNLPVAGLGATVTVSVTEPFTFFTPIIGGLFPGFALGSASTGFVMAPLGGVAPSPSPSPSPTPTPTSGPNPTPTPTPAASPTPTPTPQLCTVPNFVGQHSGSGLVTQWTGAGFMAGNFSNTVKGNGLIKGQSLGAGTSQECLAAAIILN